MSDKTCFFCCFFLFPELFLLFYIPIHLKFNYPLFPFCPLYFVCPLSMIFWLVSQLMSFCSLYDGPLLSSFLSFLFLQCPDSQQCLRAAIRMILEVYQRYKHNHSLELDSGSDCVSGENNQNNIPYSRKLWRGF